METTPKPSTVKDIETFISTYATLANDHYLLPLALWVAGTHIWPTFDCFPYLVITAYVKRAGKTRLMELLAMLTANGKTFSSDSPAAMFRSLAADKPEQPGFMDGPIETAEDFFKPTMFIDEAEKLNHENHPAREFLNKGYKRGQTITRVQGNEVVDFECYCPKAFVLIGDVYDTLRDRSIVVTMRRRSPIEAANETKFRRSIVEPAAKQLRDSIRNRVCEMRSDIDEIYGSMDSLSFLNDRDEELWTPLFAIAKILCPERMAELTKSAVDIATEKTIERRNWREVLNAEETKADNAEAGILLLRDMLALTAGKLFIRSSELVDKLKEIPTSPWRAYKGHGLSMQDCAYLLDAMNIRPKLIRMKPGKYTPKAISRGYRREDLTAAAKLVGLK